MNSNSHNNFIELLEIGPYSLCRKEKRAVLFKALKDLSIHHYLLCKPYKKIIDSIRLNLNQINDIEGLPFLPVSLFKEYELSSVDGGEIFKILTSSGTSGQKPSKIFLDKYTSLIQTKVLAKLIFSIIGPERLPMIILDCPSILKDRQNFSARGAGILGFSIFGRDHLYAFNDDMSLNFDAIDEFIKKHNGKEIILFGFTFMIWEYFYSALSKAPPRKLKLENAILFHGGGWKKLESRAVSRPDFKEGIMSISGISRIYDYYGMVEQIGSINIECELGHLHTSIFGDVIIRRPHDLSIASHGELGLVQVLSILPFSYPGHSLLTEDEGVIIGEDDCPCGKKGKYFSISGRIKSAEVRGCSDTYA